MTKTHRARRGRAAAVTLAVLAVAAVPTAAAVGTSDEASPPTRAASTTEASTTGEQRADAKRPKDCKRGRVCATRGDSTIASSEGNWYSSGGNMVDRVQNMGNTGGRDRIKVGAHMNTKCLKPGSTTHFGGKTVKLFSLEWKYAGCKDKPSK